MATIETTTDMKKKNPAAVSLGRKGGKAAAGKGAKARFAKMTAEEKTALAKKAAETRWGKQDDSK